MTEFSSYYLQLRRNHPHLCLMKLTEVSFLAIVKRMFKDIFRQTKIFYLLDNCQVSLKLSIFVDDEKLFQTEKVRYFEKVISLLVAFLSASQLFFSHLNCFYVWKDFFKDFLWNFNPCSKINKFRKINFHVFKPVIGIATAWPLLLSCRALTGAGSGALFFFGFCVVPCGDFPTPLSLETSWTAVGFGGGALFFFLLSTMFSAYFSTLVAVCSGHVHSCARKKVEEKYSD